MAAVLQESRPLVRGELVHFSQRRLPSRSGPILPSRNAAMRPIQASARGVQPRIQRFGRQPASKPRRGAQDTVRRQPIAAKWVCNGSCGPFCGSVPLLSLTFLIYLSSWSSCLLLSHPDPCLDPDLLPGFLLSCGQALRLSPCRRLSASSPASGSCCVRCTDAQALQRFCLAAARARSLLCGPLGPCRHHGCGDPLPWPPDPSQEAASSIPDRLAPPSCCLIGA